jgi:hypothetical protein
MSRALVSASDPRLTQGMRWKTLLFGLSLVVRVMVVRTHLLLAMMRIVDIVMLCSLRLRLGLGSRYG